jgi:Na+-driven multidrug efflux pump
VTVLIILSFLLGAILGRFFKVFFLIPWAILIGAVIAVSGFLGQGPLQAALEYAAFSISLQAGYVLSLLAAAMWGRLRLARRLLSERAVAPACLPVAGLAAKGMAAGRDEARQP